jgi:hypothetical protein
LSWRNYASLKDQTINPWISNPMLSVLSEAGVLITQQHRFYFFPGDNKGNQNIKDYDNKLITKVF